MRYFILFLLFAVIAQPAEKFRADDPLRSDLQPIPVTNPARRKLSDYYDTVTHTIATPGDLNRKRRQPIAAQGINTLGEPLQGDWWVQRHYYQPMTIEELVAGPGNSHPPAREGAWTVIGAKNEGVTPGFVMRDSRKELYFIKFDPIANPEMATGADHIAIRFVHALGYHVPENYLVEFPEDRLVIGEDVTLADRLGRRHRMTSGDLKEMLAKVPKTGQGLYRATASRAIAGRGIGPYRYFGQRHDDPNDYVPHEHRRDLRGFAVVSAWLGHDDSRAINTYDALLDADAMPHIRHYILDLGSTLGSGTQVANSARSGGEYLFGWKQSAEQLFTLGLAVPQWARAHYPHLPSVGRFESHRFNPETWVPEYPNPAFLNRLPDDEFWAAKQIVALRDAEIKAVVQSAHYSDAQAEAWLIQCLIERRDKIGRAYFAKLLPLDRFTVRDGRLSFTDLAGEASLGEAGPYAVEWLALDNSSGTATPIAGANSAILPPEGGAYRVARITSAKRPKQSIDVTLRFDSSPAVVGIERHW